MAVRIKDNSIYEGNYPYYGLFEEKEVLVYFVSPHHGFILNALPSTEYRIGDEIEDFDETQFERISSGKVIEIDT